MKFLKSNAGCALNDHKHLLIYKIYTSLCITDVRVGSKFITKPTIQAFSNYYIKPLKLADEMLVDQRKDGHTNTYEDGTSNKMASAL